MRTVAHPRVLLLAALCAGLLVGGVGPTARSLAPAAAAVFMAVGVVGRRAAVGMGAAALVLAGAAGAQARLTALDRTALKPLLGHSVALRAVVLEPPRERAWGGWSTAARIGAGPGRGERIVVRSRGARPPGVGEELALRGRLERLEAWESFEARRGAHAALEATALAATGGRRGGLDGLIDGVRRRAEAALASGLDPPQAALARGMVLGQDDALDKTTRDAFRAAGLGHLLAASGQNVALLALLAGTVVTLAGGGLRLRLACALALVALYVPLAGAGPSIVRAGIMGGAALVAGLAGRPVARAYALLLAVAGTLALNPRMSADVGWQLSFAAVVAIAVLAPPIRKALVDRRWARPVAEAVAITVAATLGTAPLSALQFEQVSLVSLPANLLAAVAVAPVVWLGTLAGLLGQAGPVARPLVDVLGAVLALPLGFVALVAEAASSAPHALVPLRLGVPAAIGAYAVVALVAWSPRVRSALVRGGRSRRVRAAGVGAAIAAVSIAWALRPVMAQPPRAPTVSFLDVGQGDAILLQEGARTVLIDTGPVDGPVLRRLREAGVRRLDLLVLTHGEADHLGAATAILEAIEVAAVLDGGATAPADPRTAARVEAAIQRSGARRVVPRAGQRLAVGSFSLEVLWPPADVPPTPGGDPNGRAVVLHVRRGALDVLLTADAESPVLAALDLPPVELLKVAHHGSADPGLGAVLERTDPHLAVIEVGRENGYGHPDPGTLATLEQAGVRVVRTDRDGTIRVTFDGDALHLATDR